MGGADQVSYELRVPSGDEKEGVKGENQGLARGCPPSRRTSACPTRDLHMNKDRNRLDREHDARAKSRQREQGRSLEFVNPAPSGQP